MCRCIVFNQWHSMLIKPTLLELHLRDVNFFYSFPLYFCLAQFFDSISDTFLFY